ncbi:hypothetical protein Poly41_34700 [Novipirellula artificiosorum]|uniref:Uncharacterized protein n=1 Tax=Novipirellula artificiosorum TaxID=2528016 RepID=A0A5C6DKF6_9BACT|nr:hypothetical protein Poly41_34700 [Novipirellula artificiosorum]
MSKLPGVMSIRFFMRQHLLTQFQPNRLQSAIKPHDQESRGPCGDVAQDRKRGATPSSIRGKCLHEIFAGMTLATKVCLLDAKRLDCVAWAKRTEALLAMRHWKGYPDQPRLLKLRLEYKP